MKSNRKFPGSQKYIVLKKLGHTSGYTTYIWIIYLHFILLLNALQVYLQRPRRGNGQTMIVTILTRWRIIIYRCYQHGDAERFVISRSPRNHRLLEVLGSRIKWSGKRINSATANTGARADIFVFYLVIVFRFSAAVHNIIIEKRRLNKAMTVNCAVLV